MSSDSFSAQIREAASEILRNEPEKRMNLNMLRGIVERKLAKTLSQQRFMGALSIKGAGFTVQEAEVTISEKKRLSSREFILLALEVLPMDGCSGFHVTYSGFNQAFKEYFGVTSITGSIRATAKLAEDGEIDILPVRGGVIIAKPGSGRKIYNAEHVFRKMDLCS